MFIFIVTKFRCLYLQSTASPLYYFKIHFYYVFSYTYAFQTVPYLYIFLSQICTLFSFLPLMSHALLISSSLILSL